MGTKLFTIRLDWHNLWRIFSYKVETSQRKWHAVVNNTTFSTSTSAMSKQQSGRQIISIWSLNCIKLQQFQPTMHSPFGLYFQGPRLSTSNNTLGDESYQLDQPTLHSPILALYFLSLANHKSTSSKSNC